MATFRARERLDRAAVALAGLSVGDAFGERFFVEPALAERMIAERIVPDASWLTVGGLGGRNTTCTIVGGIVACSVGEEGIPAASLQAREPLPEWRV